MDQILENDASEELKTTDIIAGKNNDMDKNEDEIHQDKPTKRKIWPVITFVADTDVPAIKNLRKRRAQKLKQ